MQTCPAGQWMSSKGTCYGNAAVETVFKTIKAETVIFCYINGFHNPRRRHSASGGKSHLAFERQVA